MFTLRVLYYCVSTSAHCNLDILNYFVVPSLFSSRKLCKLFSDYNVKHFVKPLETFFYCTCFFYYFQKGCNKDLIFEFVVTFLECIPGNVMVSLCTLESKNEDIQLRLGKPRRYSNAIKCNNHANNAYN